MPYDVANILIQTQYIVPIRQGVNGDRLTIHLPIEENVDDTQPVGACFKTQLSPTLQPSVNPYRTTIIFQNVSEAGSYMVLRRDHYNKIVLDSRKLFLLTEIL